MDPRGAPSSDAASAEHAALLEESLDDLYENAPCGYLSTLEDGTIVRANRTFLGWTGYDREDLVARKRIHDLLAPGDRIFYETHWAPLLHMQGAVREVAVELIRADGGRLPVLLNSVLKGGADEGPSVVRTTVFDATDRRRYEQELLRARREAEERARAALALAYVNDGVLLADPNGRIQLVNGAGASILGLSAEADLGRPVAEAIPGWSAIAARIPVGRPERWPTPATLPLARGSAEAWIAIAGVDSGDGVVYTFRDVTSRRRLDELRNEVVAVVSHELRTPLAGMYGAAKTLLEQEALDEALRSQLLDLIVEQGDVQRRVLDEIALTSRLDADGVELTDEVFDAGEALAAVAEAFADAGGRISVEVADPVRVRGDRGRTEQALGNLVDNALKYSGAPVRLAARRLGRWGRFTVADEGPGIPPGEGELVFEKFYRLDPGQRGGVAGVGLGLYIARELVGLMGGRIGIDPAESGATFFVELPLAESATRLPGR